MTDLREADGNAITRAISILNAAGYDVTKVGNGETAADGVAFRLDVEAPTRYKHFSDKALLVEDALEELPDLGDLAGEGGL